MARAENGNPAHAVYLGVCPRDGKMPGGNYPRISEFKTTEFRYEFDDVTKEYTIDKIDSLGKAVHSIKIKETSIEIQDLKNNRLRFDFTTGSIEMMNEQGNGLKVGATTILGKGIGAKSALYGETTTTLI